MKTILYIFIFIINCLFFFIGETQSKLSESERSKNELLDRLSKLSNESESIVNQLEAAELKASAAEKSAGTMETQLQETQVFFCQIMLLL